MCTYGNRQLGRTRECTGSHDRQHHWRRSWCEECRAARTSFRETRSRTRRECLPKKTSAWDRCKIRLLSEEQDHPPDSHSWNMKIPMQGPDTNPQKHRDQPEWHHLRRRWSQFPQSHCCTTWASHWKSRTRTWSWIRTHQLLRLHRRSHVNHDGKNVNSGRRSAVKKRNPPTKDWFSKHDPQLHRPRLQTTSLCIIPTLEPQWTHSRPGNTQSRRLTRRLVQHQLHQAIAQHLHIVGRVGIEGGTESLHILSSDCQAHTQNQHSSCHPNARAATAPHLDSSSRQESDKPRNQVFKMQLLSCWSAREYCYQLNLTPDWVSSANKHYNRNTADETQPRNDVCIERHWWKCQSEAELGLEKLNAWEDGGVVHIIRWGGLQWSGVRAGVGSEVSQEGSMES